MKRALLVMAMVLLLPVAIIAGVMLASHSPAAPVYKPSVSARAMRLPLRLRNRTEHDAVRRRLGNAPYVLELTSGRGTLVFYGAHHTRNPRDPQMADIERRWRAFGPTVALYEGRQRNFFHTSLLDPLKGKTEAEKLHQLAVTGGVKVYSLEPAYADEVAQLLDRWSPEEVALYFFTRVYWSESGGEADDALALDLLKKRTDVDGLRGSLQTLSDVDRVWRRLFPELGDWRTQRDEPDHAWFIAISDASRSARGQHMARTLIDLTRSGERVFAVVGSGHVIRSEWTLRAALGAPPAPDQPVERRSS